jgi:hypothetical protein
MTDEHDIKKDHPTRGMKLLFILLWMSVWPIIVLIIGVILFVICYVLMQVNRSTQFEVYMGIFFASIVLICVLGFAILIRVKNTLARLGGKVLGIYTVGGIMMIIFILSYALGQKTTDQIGTENDQVATAFVTPNLQRNQNIDSSLRAIGAPDVEISKFSTAYVDTFSSSIVDNQLGLYKSYINPTDGKFLYGEMLIKRGQDPSMERTMVAHEYLHHIWYSSIDEKIKSRLESDLISTYGNDPAIRERTSSYTRAQNLKSTELFSYYCTESSDDYLSGFILEQCNKYINRASLQLLR